MIVWPASLITDLARRRTVLFLGSGISGNSTSATGRHPKSWEQFLTDAANDVNPKRYINKLIKERDYLTACELLRNSIGRENFNQYLKSEFLTPAYKQAPIHELIFKLDSRVVATPNFDKIYETYANHQAGGSIIIKHHYDPDIAEAIRGTDRIILKIHGTIDSPDQMVFTRKEYAAAREKYRSFYSLLEALALTHTFLFMGCGLHDPDIRLLLEDTFFRHPSSRTHIFVLPTRQLHDSVISVLQESMNLTMLKYSPANNHKELGDSIAQLLGFVEAARESLRQNMNW